MIQCLYHLAFHTLDFTLQHDNYLLWSLLIQYHEIWTVLLMIQHVIFQNRLFTRETIAEDSLNLLCGLDLRATNNLRINNNLRAAHC
jgi:hypothetical protein